MTAATLPAIPAGDLEPTEAEMARARGEMAKCREHQDVYGCAYAALARLESVAWALEHGFTQAAAEALRRLRAVDKAAVERLRELDEARKAAEQ